MTMALASRQGSPARRTCDLLCLVGTCSASHKGNESKPSTHAIPHAPNVHFRKTHSLKRTKKQTEMEQLSKTSTQQSHLPSQRLEEGSGPHDGVGDVPGRLQLLLERQLGALELQQGPLQHHGTLVRPTKQTNPSICIVECLMLQLHVKPSLGRSLPWS